MQRFFLIVCCWSCWVRSGFAPPVPAVHGGIDVMETEQLLAPGNPVKIKLGVGQAKFMRFDCENGPADAVVSLKTYSESADPLLFLSADPVKQPRFADNDGSSFAHWREDSSGDHYASVKGVSPRGGMLGLFNLRKFASEELDAILTLRCSSIIAYDGLFWDHLRTNGVCPVGTNLREDGTEEAGMPCSWHGKCQRHGECLCRSGYTGPACEHKQHDVVRNQDFNFELKAGQYQYFRVHVPPRFMGGYVQVTLKSSTPFAVLVKSDDLPSKNNFDFSNFDDWLNHKNQTDIKFKVTASDGIEAAPIGEVYGIDGPPPEHEDNDGMGDNKRRLSPTPGQCANQQYQLPQLQYPLCDTEQFNFCSQSCMQCLNCVQNSENKMSCGGSCQHCRSPKCSQALAACGSGIPCAGPEASKCEERCGPCMAECLNNKDPRCALCDCCESCLPLLAKCTSGSALESRYVFVGIYHHRRYGASSGASAQGKVDIALREDEFFVRQGGAVPKSWTSDLYDTFHDLRSVENANSEAYPDTEQFMYDLEIKHEETVHQEVRLFRDRLTLLHLKNVHQLKHMSLTFRSGPKITHVLTASGAAPKTLFDFDDQAAQQGFGDAKASEFVIHARHRQNIWCAIFSKADGYTQITSAAYGSDGNSGSSGFAVVLVFGLVCCLSGGLKRFSDGLRRFSDSDEPGISLIERLGNMVASRTGGTESAASLTSLTQAGSLQGFSGSDVIDQSVEDRFLHRGGLGDEGL